ncbi:MAG TPA: hemerythrin domain-containing protein [Acidimicrobiales bacterium]|nr:hemerythrin domain-containing protein [Acidimicrobiales bacterium]
MCSYCGCDAERVIAELMDEHEQISWLAGRLLLAYQRGDRQLADALGEEIAGRFDHHATKEERGLFSQLLEAALGEDAVAELESDHRDLRPGLRGAVDGTWIGPGGLIDRLLRHAEREDSDVFPFALQLLPNQAWAEIQAVHHRFDGAPSRPAGARQTTIG